MHTYMCAVKMAEHATSSEALVSVCRTNVGRPKKFFQPWNSVMKRAYITADMRKISSGLFRSSVVSSSSELCSLLQSSA